jgi:hypothetical protein
VSAGSLCKTLLDFGLLLHQFTHPCLHGRLVHSIFNGVENPFSAPLNLLKGAAARFCFRPPLTAAAVGLLCIGAHCDRHSPGRYQLVGKARQHTTLDFVTANSTAIAADPLAKVAKTAVALFDDDAIFSTATSAGEQARQKEGRTTLAVVGAPAWIAAGQTGRLAWAGRLASRLQTGRCETARLRRGTCVPIGRLVAPLIAELQELLISVRAPASVAAEARGSLAEDIGPPLSAVAEVFAAEVVEAFAVAADAVRTSGSSTMWCY